MAVMHAEVDIEGISTLTVALLLLMKNQNWTLNLALHLR